MAKSTKLSEFELEVMQLLWQLGEASTPQLHERILLDRDVGYSTVRTIVDRLERKKAIRRTEQRGRAITFVPALNQSNVSRSLVQSFVERVFAGEPKPLFSHLLESESIDANDIEYLENLLAKRKRQLGLDE